MEKDCTFGATLRDVPLVNSDEVTVDSIELPHRVSVIDRRFVHHFEHETVVGQLATIEFAMVTADFPLQEMRHIAYARGAKGIWNANHADSVRRLPADEKVQGLMSFARKVLARKTTAFSGGSVTGVNMMCDSYLNACKDGQPLPMGIVLRRTNSGLGNQLKGLFLPPDGPVMVKRGWLVGLVMEIR